MDVPERIVKRLTELEAEGMELLRNGHGKLKGAGSVADLYVEGIFHAPPPYKGSSPPPEIAAWLASLEPTNERPFVETLAMQIHRVREIRALVYKGDFLRALELSTHIMQTSPALWRSWIASKSLNVEKKGPLPKTDWDALRAEAVQMRGAPGRRRSDLEISKTLAKKYGLNPETVRKNLRK